MYAYTRTYIYIYVCVCAYIYTYIYMYSHVYVCVYIHESRGRKADRSPPPHVSDSATQLLGAQRPPGVAQLLASRVLGMPEVDVGETWRGRFPKIGGRYISITDIHTCTYTCIYTHTYAYMYRHAYVFVYIYMYTHIDFGILSKVPALCIPGRWRHFPCYVGGLRGAEPSSHISHGPNSLYKA